MDAALTHLTQCCMSYISVANQMTGFYMKCNTAKMVNNGI